MAMREVAAYCNTNGQNFRYETGQETPITLVRAIQDVGLDNQGVNFDLANLILYGKANRLTLSNSSALLCREFTPRTGSGQTNPKELGEEVPIGRGKVDFPRIIKRLKELNYRGASHHRTRNFRGATIGRCSCREAYLEKLIG